MDERANVAAAEVGAPHPPAGTRPRPAGPAPAEGATGAARRNERGRWLQRLLARTVPADRLQRLEQRDTLVAVLLLVVILLSGLNIVMLVQLRRLEQLPSELLGTSADQVARLQHETFTYVLKIDQPLRVQTEVPIQRTIDVPINTTLPISTTINVPLDLPMGRVELPIPVRANVPIDLAVQVPISETLQIDTTVPIRTDLPIAIRIEDTPLKSYLEELERLLRRVQR